MDDGIGTAAITSKVQDLSDLELAALLCFVADQHCCIVQADEDQLDQVGRELELICQRSFTLPCVTLSCSSRTTLDEFGNGILLPEEDTTTPDYLDPNGRPQYRSSLQSASDLRDRIAPVVIASRLNETDQEVQIQALELIRSKRLSPSKCFLLIVLMPRGSQRLTAPLNDQIFISHTHDPLDPLVYIHSSTPKRQISNDSLSSIIRSPPSTPGYPLTSKITQEDIQTLRSLLEKTTLDSDVRAYVHDLTIFLRTNRFVSGGVSALATLHFHLLCRVLAPLHGLTFITPSLVDLAARKIYTHRLVLATAESERSRMWGSSWAAVGEVLENGGISSEGVVDMVIEAVSTPL